MQREILYNLTNQEDQHNPHHEFGQTQNQHASSEWGDVLDDRQSLRGLGHQLEKMVDPEPDGHPSPCGQDGGGVRPGGAVTLRHGVIVTQEERHHNGTHGEEGAGRVQVVDEGPDGVGEDDEDGGDQDAAQHILRGREKLVSASLCAGKLLSQIWLT